MSDIRDVHALKHLRLEFLKRKIDTSMADLRVSHGVAYIRGTLKMDSDGAGDIHDNVNHAMHALKGRQEFRDIVLDATLR